ncbi:hypothetical protein BX592_105269 [Paraburkholderia rhizosphaerae]|uniref:Uncharacterized protein n=1 Tax=Paraburkholderia rhizosphaerae TaxID=480658 RepID=A0A4R8LWQ9_9BURK|nr:hypothetical protein BX592_105269 [Paraburkholderia rhizosphaerae]
MKQNLNPVVARVLKRLHYPLDVIACGDATTPMTGFPDTLTLD